MQMTIDQKFQTNVSIDKVWEFLNDPYKVVTCVPGAKITEEIDKDNFKGIMRIKVGPITTEYNGDASIEVRNKDKYEMQMSGKGVASRAMGNATMKMIGNLQKLENGGTEVAINVNIIITGRIAQLGSRMINAVSDRMFNEFVNNFENKIQSNGASENKTFEDQANEVEPISVLSIMSAVTPFWVKILVPLGILIILIILFSFFNII